MPKSSSALRSGLLLLGSIVLIVCVIVGIKGLNWLRDPAEHYLVAFPLRTNIGGLRIGDEVRIGGFKVGEVKRITLEKDTDPARDPYFVLVAFTVPGRYSIREDAQIRIDGTLTGTSWLNFESIGKGNKLSPTKPLMGGPSSTSELLAKVQSLEPRLNSILAQLDEKTLPAINGTLADVRTKTVPLVNQTVEKFGQTAESFKKTGDSANALVGDLKESYKPVLLAEYVKVTKKTVEMMEAIRALFGDTTDDFRTTIANLRKSTDAVREKLPAILEKVDGALVKVDSAVDKVNVAMEDVKKTMANAKDLSASAREVITGNKGKLDATIDSVKQAGDNLKNATAEIRRSPWRLLYKPAPNEMANLNIYDASRQFAEGANDLTDAATALRDAIKSNQGDPEEIKKLMKKLDESFTNFKTVEEKLWATVKE